MSARPLDLQRSEQEEFKGTARPISLQEKDINRFRSLVNAPLKGLYKAGLGLFQNLPLALEGPNVIPYLLTGKSILPKGTKEAVSKGLEKGEQFIETMLPTRPEMTESFLERAGGIAPFALGGAASLPSKLLRTGAAALGGQAVEELGGNPLLQVGAEAAAFGAPSLARKIIPSNAEQKAIVDLGRKYNLSEEQLAPLMPETKKRRFFGRFAHAGEGAQEAVKGMRAGVQKIYQELESSPEAKKFLSPQQVRKFSVDMNAIGQKMPHAIRSQVQHDALDLVKAAAKKGGLTGEELFNFYHDISSRFNIGRTQLELFKQPIREALKSIDPKMAKDFETVNRMFQKSLQMGRILKPSQFEELISLGEAYELSASIANLDTSRLTKLLGFAGFRKLSEKMLTSPRLQNLFYKSQVAVKDHKLPIMKKIGDEILREFEDHSE